MIQRIRVTRIVREEVELTVNFHAGRTAHDIREEDLFAKATQVLGKPTKAVEKYDVTWQYGYIPAEQEVADVGLGTDGLIVCPS